MSNTEFDVEWHQTIKANTAAEAARLAGDMLRAKEPQNLIFYVRESGEEDELARIVIDPAPAAPVPLCTHCDSIGQSLVNLLEVVVFAALAMAAIYVWKYVL